MIPTTLVVGRSASAREQAIAARMDERCNTALILEGMPDGINHFAPFTNDANIRIKRIAPGCICCTGNLTMRVTLDRLLRHPPEQLYISLATTQHIDSVRQFLTRPPYDALLALTEDLPA